MRHGKFGNVDYKLGIVMLVGTIVGFEVGAQMVMWLERIGKVELYVRWLYVGLLTFIAWMVFMMLQNANRKSGLPRQRDRKSINSPPVLSGTKPFTRSRSPPMMHFNEAGFTCSIWAPVFVSF